MNYPESVAAVKQLLKSAFMTFRQIDFDTYEELSAMPMDFADEITEVYKRLITECDRKKLYDRIQKGADMIEYETDPVKRRLYIELYEELILKLEKMRSA